MLKMIWNVFILWWNCGFFCWSAAGVSLSLKKPIILLYWAAVQSQSVLRCSVWSRQSGSESAGFSSIPAFQIVPSKRLSPRFLHLLVALAVRKLLFTSGVAVKKSSSVRLFLRGPPRRPDVSTRPAQWSSLCPGPQWPGLSPLKLRRKEDQDQKVVNF